MLGDPAVQSALRRRAEDADPEVRRTAFLLSLHTRERLLEALRSVDPELQRQLAELEGATAEEAAPPAKAKKGKPAKAEARARRGRWRMPTSSRCSRRRPAAPSTPASAGRGAWPCWATPGPSACSSS